MRNHLRKKKKKKKKVGQIQRLKRFMGEETISFFFLPAIHHFLGEHELSIFQIVGDFVELSSKQLIKLLKVEISHLLKSSSFMIIYLCDSIRWISVSMQVPQDRFITAINWRQCSDPYLTSIYIWLYSPFGVTLKCESTVGYNQPKTRSIAVLIGVYNGIYGTSLTLNLEKLKL